MQDQQVGDAFVFGEGQAEGWFGLAAGLSVSINMTINMTIYSIHMSVDSINMAVHTIYSVGNSIFCKDKFTLNKPRDAWREKKKRPYSVDFCFNVELYHPPAAPPPPAHPPAPG